MALAATGRLPRRQRSGVPTRRRRIQLAAQGFAVAERKKETALSEESEMGVALKEAFGSSDPSLQGADPEWPVAPERDLRAWLEERGCEGLDRVVFRGTSGLGVWLRPGLPRTALRSGAEVVRVPREAWISESAEVAEPEMELAWRLLQERWRGSSSAYAPYVDFLWRVDQRLHPLFWEESETDWLMPSQTAYEELMDLRARTDRRVRALADRARAAGSKAPKELLQSPKRLDYELRFALCLVEVRGTVCSPDKPGQPQVAAMIPVLDSLRHDGSGSPPAQVGEPEGGQGGPHVVAALAGLQDGGELKHQYEPISSSSLLVRYGQATRRKTMDEAREANAYHAVAVSAKRTTDSEGRNSPAVCAIKLEMLASRVGLDLREGASLQDSTISLPQDLFRDGRLLRAVRFLYAEVPSTLKVSEEEACNDLYNRYFAGFDDKQEARRRQPPPRDNDTLHLEVMSRAEAWDWCDKAHKRYVKALKGILAEFDDDEPRPTIEAAAEGDGELKEGSIVMAHFKAKGKGGAKVRSRSAKEARVKAVEADGVVTVQFLANGVRQRVPRDWVELPRNDAGEADADVKGHDDEPNGKALEGIAKEVHHARAQLALALLQTETAVVEVCAMLNQNMVRQGLEVLDSATKRENMANVHKFNKLWDTEQNLLDSWEKSSSFDEA